MISLRLIVVLCFTSSVLFGQQFDGVFIEKKKVDEDNTIYKPGNTFIYSAKITKEGEVFYLNEEALLTADQNDSHNVLLACVAPKKRTNKNQTEVYYTLDPFVGKLISTGIVENATNTWLHPPRTGFLRSLETCPFPYIRYDKEVGESWEDAMKIGTHWSDPEWGTWDSPLLLTYSYQIIEETTIDTELGQLPVQKVEATASSGKGSSKFMGYFSAQYGFVKMEFELFNRIKIELDLIETESGNPARSAEEFMENQMMKNGKG